MKELNSFVKSCALKERYCEIIPGGSHTYAKGDDQFPEFYAPYIERGQSCHVWDVDGNEYIEYGMGLRAVTLGHAYKPVIEAAYRQMLMGVNFTRPARIELEAAEKLQNMIDGAEMVKFGKNGSDVTNAAIRLARAYTGRDLIAICSDHPFFSVDDWFIGATPMFAGIPKAVRDLTVSFRYNDLKSLEELFESYPNQIACAIMEPAKGEDPQNHFLHKAQELCHINGSIFILDEMITGFRWHDGGGQKYYNIVPDLSAFGKAIANGFAVSALVGKREIMKLGGLDHDKERVFLLSLTHGAETHSLAAAIETMAIYQREPVVDTLWKQGLRLEKGICQSAERHGLSDYFKVIGKPCCLVYATFDNEKRPSQAFRTLFLQEIIRRGVLAPSFITSYSHSDYDIDQTIDVVDEALGIYALALEDGVEKYLKGRSVKPVWRRYN